MQSSEDRQRIVRQELEKITKEKYITPEMYTAVVDAHQQFYDDIEKRREAAWKKEQKLSAVTNTRAVAAGKEEIIHSHPSSSSEEGIQKQKLTPQQIRERNIKWLLNLGVLMLLIGGLVLATSTWSSMPGWMKTGFLFLSSVLFFGLAQFMIRVVKLEKTAFAFYVLSALFLPIVILSSAYYELFGTYFSLSGEGRYLVGTIGSMLVLPIYAMLAIRLSSRLFVWFSYVTLTVWASFSLASLPLSIDGFYLGMMLFNTVLIIGYTFLRWGRFPLFRQEASAYIQVNLILSTAFMILFYDYELTHGFNLILAGVLYFAMIFVTKHAEYHFVFSAMLVYGAYQIIEFSMLYEIKALPYALLGFIFLFIPKWVSGEKQLQKAFRYTSAFVSGCAFLYISFEGMMLRMGEPSLILLIAYLIITVNFIYLTNLEKKNPLFAYLSPLFMMTAFYEAILLGQMWFGYDSLRVPLFFTGVLLYGWFGCFTQQKFLQRIKESSRDVAMVVMLLCATGEFLFEHWWRAGALLLMLSIVMLLMERFEKRSVFTRSDLPSWLHALFLGAAVAVFYEAFDQSRWTTDWLGSMGIMNVILASFAVLGASYFWNTRKKKTFSQHALYISNMFYAFGMWLAFFAPIHELNRSLIVFGGIGMAYLLYRKTNWDMLPYVVSSLTLMFYGTLLHAQSLHVTITFAGYHALKYVVGALLLFGIGSLFRKTDQRLSMSFWRVGHLYLPIALFITVVFSGELAYGALFIATALYSISMLYVKQEWLIRGFLYAAISIFWAGVSLFMFAYGWEKYVPYAFLLTSLLSGTIWYVVQTPWKKRLAYYVTPFSILGIVTFAFMEPSAGHFIVTLLYATGVLFVLHEEKWDLFNLIPLLIIYYATIDYGSTLYHPYAWSIVMVILAVICNIIGRMMYSMLYETVKGQSFTVRIDWYTVISFLAVVYLYVLVDDALWTRLLPGVGLSLSAWTQQRRIPNILPEWIRLGAGAYLIQPYYVLLGWLLIPTLFVVELYVIPWIVFTVFLKRIRASQQLKQIANYVQWGVLVIAFLLLIQHALVQSTVVYALKLGVLSIASMFVGMAFRTKSFFFIGGGVLLLNIFLQTRPFWGNLPWWVYLLIGGATLIAVASVNEWHKQKLSQHEVTFISKIRKKILAIWQTIHTWD